MAGFLAGEAKTIHNLPGIAHRQNIAGRRWQGSVAALEQGQSNIPVGQNGGFGTVHAQSQGFEDIKIGQLQFDPDILCLARDLLQRFGCTRRAVDTDGHAIQVARCPVFPGRRFQSEKTITGTDDGVG